MALHYEAAGNWMRAVHSLLEAARHASGRQSHAEASELLEHARRVADNLTGPERETVLRDLRNELKNTLEADFELAKSLSGTSTKA